MIKEHQIYKGYAADENGNIYNKSKHNKRQPNEDGWRLMLPVKHDNGYYSVNVWYADKIRQISAHKIVYECNHQIVHQYNSRHPDGLTINHIDENKSNNHISNLEVITMSQNAYLGNVGKKAKPETIKKLKAINGSPKRREENRQKAIKQNQPKDVNGRFV